MKKFTVTTLLLLLLFSFTAYAGSGNSNGKYGKTKVCSNVSSGTLETIKGTVIGIGNHDGLVVDTGNSHVTIYRIGHEWYWEDK